MGACCSCCKPTDYEKIPSTDSDDHLHHTLYKADVPRYDTEHIAYAAQVKSDEAVEEAIVKAGEELGLGEKETDVLQKLAEKGCDVTYETSSSSTRGGTQESKSTVFEGKLQDDGYHVTGETKKLVKSGNGGKGKKTKKGKGKGSKKKGTADKDTDKGENKNIAETVDKPVVSNGVDEKDVEGVGENRDDVKEEETIAKEPVSNSEEKSINLIEIDEETGGRKVTASTIEQEITDATIADKVVDVNPDTSKDGVQSVKTVSDINNENQRHVHGDTEPIMGTGQINIEDEEVIAEQIDIEDEEVVDKISHIETIRNTGDEKQTREEPHFNAANKDMEGVVVTGKLLSANDDDGDEVENGQSAPLEGTDEGSRERGESDPAIDYKERKLADHQEPEVVRKVSMDEQLQSLEQNVTIQVPGVVMDSGAQVTLTPESDKLENSSPAAEEHNVVHADESTPK